MGRLQFICCLILLIASRSSIAAEGTPSWDEIRDRYLANVESVATLDITADLTFGFIDREGKRIGPGETGDLGNGAVTGTKLSLHWVKDGSSEFVHLAPMLQVPPDPVCMFTDGTDAYQLNFRGKECVRISKTAKTESITGEMRGVNGVNPLLECMGWNTLATVVRQVSPLSIESDTVDDIPCWKVDLGECGFPTIKGILFEWHVTAWFQADASGIPIQIYSQGVKYKADRRVKVHRMLKHGDIWLPDSFELVAGPTSGHFTIGRILTVKLNEPVSRSAFTVPAEYRKQDVVNIDKKSEVQKHLKKLADADGTTARQQAEFAKMVQQVRQQATRVEPASTNLESLGVVAIPQRQDGLVLWLAVAGVVLLCGGTILVFRRS